MPVEFLTAEQRSRYGCYVGEPSPEQLALYFHLDDRDRALLEPRRHDHTRLGFAVQLATARFRGTFLSDPTDDPHSVVLSLASQLNIADPTVLTLYREGQMRYDHVHEIMQEYGYQDFASQPAHFRFLRWLYTRAWWSEERLTVLFDLAMAHLIDRKVLLPGVSVLERAVSSVREHATMRFWQLLAQLPTPPQRALLETLLVVPEGERQTPLDRLRRAPTRVSGPALVQALRRVDAIRLFEMEHVDLSFVPRGRLKALARHAATAFVHNLRQLADDHRIAALLAFASTYLAVVHDDALDLFDVLMRTASSQATREGQQARLRTIHDLDAAAQVLSEACQVILDETQDPVTLHERIYARISAEHLQAAVITMGELTRPPGKLGENSDANTGLRAPCPNFHPKNVWMKIRIHFGDGSSGSSEEGCFSSSFAFLPFVFGFFCSSPDSCFSCSSSLRRLFSASMIWILSRRRVSSSAAAFRW